MDLKTGTRAHEICLAIKLSLCLKCPCRIIFLWFYCLVKHFLEIKKTLKFVRIQISCLWPNDIFFKGLSNTMQFVLHNKCFGKKVLIIKTSL